MGFIASYDLILPKCLIKVKEKKNSLSLPAHGWVGAEATPSFFSPHEKFAMSELVGVGGLEPPTSCSQSRRAGQLRHTPKETLNIKK